MQFKSKLPNVGTTIFTTMSALAEKHGAVNLGQGFPNFDCPDALKSLVNHYMQSHQNQYAPMAGVPKLRERLAEKVEKLYGRKTDPTTEITVTAGGTQALFTVIAAFIRPKDEVILIEPAYDSYAPSVEAMGGKVVPYRLAPPQYQVDWTALAQLITPKTKMIIINTPQNPTGKILTVNDLEQLAKITEGSNILVLSDEVYEHLIYDGQSHASVLRLPQLAERSIAAFSFGKTFHATGWKVGYVVAAESLMREFRKVHQFNVFSVNTPVQHALADFLADENNYLSLPNFYQTKRNFLQNQLKNSRLVPLSSAGTYFQLFDYQQISDKNDFDFCCWLTAEIGVAAIPVSVFYSKPNPKNQILKSSTPQILENTEGGISAAKIIRLCFAKTEDLLETAAARLCRL